ncbi:MAG: hypothetical protein HQL28_05860 [Candidatus Omnitrophica bacterium]|nr:hypothetical protein [Candidatus Omnitrophota bacterium]
MVKDPKKLRIFERKMLESERFSYEEAARIYDSLYHEAFDLGVITSANVMEGIENTIRLAKIINGLGK